MNFFDEFTVETLNFLAQSVFPRHFFCSTNAMDNSNSSNASKKKKKASANDKQMVNGLQGQTLLEAVKRHDVVECQKLLEKGAPVNFQTPVSCPV